MSELPTTGIDLGRHRVFAVTSTPDGLATLSMQNDHDGLLFRWLGPNGVVRVVEYLTTLTSASATHVAQQSFEMVVNRIRENRSDALDHRTLLAVPVGLPSDTLDLILDGYKQAGVLVDRQDIHPRPVASFASWLFEQHDKVNPDSLNSSVLVVDNDAGQISALIGDLDQRRLLAMGQLSVVQGLSDSGPEQQEQEQHVATGLRALISRAHHVHHRLPVSERPFQALNYRGDTFAFGHVVVSGTTTTHPAFTRLLKAAAPDATVWGLGSPESDRVVSRGLIRTNVLQGWTCAWPTGHLMIDDAVVVQPGNIPLLNQLDETETQVTLSVTDRAVIRIADAEGQYRPTTWRGKTGVGLRVPSRLGRNITVKAGTDGKVSFYGDNNARPLTIQPSWPVVDLRTDAPEVTIVKRAQPSLECE